MGMVDEVIADARSRTGLTDLGADSFHEGLEALLTGAVAAGTFNELGMAVLRDQVTGFLVTRLAGRGLVPPSSGDRRAGDPPAAVRARPAPHRLHRPELPAGPGPPVPLVAGLGERRPDPAPDPDTFTTDPRIAAAAANMALIDEMAPKFKSMLPTSPTGPTECLQILALDFRSPMFGALGDNRHYEAWMADCDMVSAYRYHERVLKLLQWRFPTRPWRLKSPAHMDTIDALLEVYPEARFVMTHRDVAQAIPSVVSLLDATSEYLRTGPLAADFAANQAAYWERSLRKTLAYRDAGNEDRFHDIGFAEMRPDPLPAMERLYEWLDVDLTPEVAAAMATWWAANPAEKQGIHDYGPEQYGIDLDDLRAQFAFYNDRFTSAT